jgi:putative membrane-bound dehydrogenase-like protein
LPPGLRIELVAAEPQISSPVDAAFDEDGRLWVVEMRDYPHGSARGQRPEGRIRVLEDRDGDGRFETSRVFADGLLFANGLLPWKRGLVVTAAPHILLLGDSDGDGTADRREILFEGFAARSPQLRVSHPVLGLDGWVYVANGLLGGRVHRPGRKEAPLDISGMDFRFDLLHDRHEAITGMGQFGNTFDDAGRRFVCDNRHHVRHVVVANRYLRRNPFLAAGVLVQDTFALQQGKVEEEGARVYPLSRNWTTSNLHTGTFTAACGVHVYGGDLLPAEYRGNAFTCEPTGSLVHREVLQPHGATFSSHPGRAGVEFLATRDDWCRPVSLAEGPDGALYVVDMYRAVIEHPEFMPPELQKRPDLLLGKDQGRIWRIVPERADPSRQRPQLSRASTAELVALLGHPGAWWRTTAQRLLLERQDRAAIEPLRRLCRNAPQALARLQAAWLLYSLDALTPDVVEPLLNDPDARVRENALVLAERWLPRSSALQERALKLADDGDGRVRFQAACSLGEWDEDRIVPALARVAVRGAADRWTRLGVCSAVPRRAGMLLGKLLQADSPLLQVQTGGVQLVQELAAVVGARQDAAEITQLVQALAAVGGPQRQRWQMAGLGGLADGMGRRGMQLASCLAALPADRRQAVHTAEELLGQAAKLAADRSRPLEARLDAVRLLAHVQGKTALPVLARLMKEDPAPEVRLAAVRALGAQPGPEVAGVLVQDWASYTPAVRREVIEAMLGQPERTERLLAEMEAGHVAATDLDALAQQRLLLHLRLNLRSRASKLLAGAVPRERKQVLEQYAPALQRKGDALRGREVFRQNCATCHQVGGVGVRVGPDISDTRTKTAEMLLRDILNPNAAIDSNYVSYTVQTKSGKEISGLIVSESAASVTLQRAEAQTETVLRQDIEEMRSSGVSLMPEGLEKTITKDQMADLLAFLKNWRYLDGQTPVGKDGR